VDYTSPSQGQVEFGWRGPFRQNGEQITLNNFPRYENNYTQTPFPAERLEIRQEEHWLVLNWREGIRDVSGYATTNGE
jgi:hypothetical protein